VPPVLKESAYGLGATTWEVVWNVVLPYTKIGVIGGIMLGLGRALGETMAVALILSVSPGVHWDIISTQNSGTIAADIALQFPESSGLDVNTLIASGLVLFFITLLVNMVARYIVSRRAEFSGAN
jgi:phosphate transport system permease protein